MEDLILIFHKVYGDIKGNHFLLDQVAPNFNSAPNAFETQKSHNLRLQFSLLENKICS